MSNSHFVSLFAAALTFAVAAHADTVSFASLSGVTTFTYITGMGAADGTGGIAVGYTASGYDTAVTGSQWVSVNTHGGVGYGVVGLTDYTTSFTLLPGETYTGSVSFMADDQPGVEINGVSIYAINTNHVWSDPPTTITLSANDFVAGVNTITLEDYNTGQVAAADFEGSVTGVPNTPEPSSLLLMGTGLLIALGVAHRHRVVITSVPSEISHSV